MSLIERASTFHRSGFERTPFVFSYDISSPKQARAVRRCLRRWRLDGQLSVHEVILTPPEAEALGVELVDLVDPKTDSLILFRLSRRGDGPVYALSSKTPLMLFAQRMAALPRYLHDGCYVVAYDVSHPRRLRRIQRVTSEQGVFLQRSVYLFRGKGSELSAMLHRAEQVLTQGEDDMRVYALSAPDDLWFLCGAVPPLTGLVNHPAPEMWQRLQRWTTNPDMEGPRNPASTSLFGANHG